MPIARLEREQAQAIVDFCHKYDLKQFYFAKDDGAYFGANVSSRGKPDFDNVVFYQKGMNPELSEHDNDGDWHDNAAIAFGGDDFGIHIEIEVLETFVNDLRLGDTKYFDIQ